MAMIPHDATEQLKKTVSIAVTNHHKQMSKPIWPNLTKRQAVGDFKGYLIGFTNTILKDAGPPRPIEVEPSRNIWLRNGRAKFKDQ